MYLVLFLLSTKVGLNLRGPSSSPLIICLGISFPATRYTLEMSYLSILLLNVIVLSYTLLLKVQS